MDDVAEPVTRGWRAPSLLLPACLLVGFCAPGSFVSRAFAAEQVRIGVARTISDVGYYVADAMGFFREQGLEVAIVPFNSAAQMVAPLGTGELEVGGGTVSAGFYNAVGRGILIKIVADQASIRPGYGFSSLLVRKDLDFFRELGLIEKKDISVDAVVDNSFVRAAVAKLGPYQAPAN